MEFLSANTPAGWIVLGLQPLLLLSFALLIQVKFGQPSQRLIDITKQLVFWVDKLSLYVAGAVKWLALFMVLMVAALVITRYVFGVSAIKAQESVIYMHAFLFLMAAPAALLTNTHVRVDIIYEKLSPKGKAFVDFFGTVFLLMPVCMLIFKFGGSYALRAWASLEGSQEATGLPAVFLLKTAIPVFAMLMMLQGSAMAARAALLLCNSPLPPVQGKGNAV